METDIQRMERNLQALAEEGREDLVLRDVDAYFDAVEATLTPEQNAECERLAGQVMDRLRAEGHI